MKLNKHEIDEAIGKATGRWLTDAEAANARKTEDYTSHTSITLFQKCPLAWKFRYIDHMKSPPPGAAQYVGIKAHSTLAKNNEHKIKTGKDLAQKLMIGAFEDAWDKDVDTVDWKSEKEMPGRAKDSTIHVLRKYHTDHAPKVKPLAAEKHFLIKIPFISEKGLYGIVDLEDRQGLCDYKTTKSTPASSDDLVYKSTQLGMYAMAKYVIDKKLPKHVRFTYLIRTQTPKVETYYGTKTMEDVQRIAYLIARITSAMKSGDFWPNTETWMHSPIHCGFWDHCNKTARLELRGF